MYSLSFLLTWFSFNSCASLSAFASVLKYVQVNVFNNHCIPNTAEISDSFFTMSLSILCSVFRSCESFVFILQYINESSVEWPVFWIRKYSTTKTVLFTKIISYRMILSWFIRYDIDYTSHTTVTGHNPVKARFIVVRVPHLGCWL